MKPKAQRLSIPTPADARPRRHSGCQPHPSTRGPDRHPGTIGQSTDYFKKLTRRNCALAGLAIVDSRAGDHFHFQISAGHRQIAAIDLDQEIGQYRQRLAPFHDVDNLLQRFEKCFSR